MSETTCKRFSTGWLCVPECEDAAHDEFLTADHPTREERYAAVRTVSAVFHDPLTPGTPVLAWPITRNGSPLVTRTRSEVWSLGDGTRVVAVEGHAGGIALTHVDVLPPAAHQVAADPAPAQPGIAQNPSGHIMGVDHDFAPGGIHDNPLGGPAPAQPDAALSDDEDYGPGCDCTELCAMGPTCPGAILAGLAGSGCWRAPDDVTLTTEERGQITTALVGRGDAYAAVERILAARAAQPVPAPEAFCDCCRGRCSCGGKRVVPAPEVSRGVAEVKAEALHPAQVGICAADHRPFIALVEANALDDVDRRLTARIGEGRDDPETAREGSYFAGFLDGLESARAEVRWKRPDPPDRIVRDALPAEGES